MLKLGQATPVSLRQSRSEVERLGKSPKRKAGPLRLRSGQALHFAESLESQRFLCGRDDKLSGIRGPLSECLYGIGEPAVFSYCTGLASSVAVAQGKFGDRRMEWTPKLRHE